MSPTLIWPYQVPGPLHCFNKKNRLTNPSKLPTPITRSWEFTIPIPHWILHFLHLEEGLLITFNVTISAHRTAEEYNSFAIRIFFRQRTERSLPPHLIEESRIVLGYQWPNLYLQLVNMVKIQITDLMDLLPQIQQFQDNYNLITSNGHSRLSKDLATFLFCSSLPDSYELTARQYLDNITAIANYKLTDIIARVLQEENRRKANALGQGSSLKEVLNDEEHWAKVCKVW